MPLSWSLTLRISFDVLEQPLDGQAVGDHLALGVIGDREEFVAERLGGLGHLFDGAPPSEAVVWVCRSPRMSCAGDQLRQLVLQRRLDLAAVFAHLRLDVSAGPSFL